MLAVRYAGAQGQIVEAALEELSGLLRRGDTPVWIDLDTPADAELRVLERELGIHHLTIEDIANQNQRPKIESFDQYVYAAVHAFAGQDGMALQLTEVDLLLGERWLLMVHYGPIPGLVEGSAPSERLFAALHRGADFLFYAALDLVVDSYFPVIDRIEAEIERLEEALLEDGARGEMNRLLALKRALVSVRRAVGPEREVLNQLTRHDLPFVSAEHAVYFRDVYDHLVRAGEEIDSLRDILSGVLEVHLSAVSNQLNVTMKRLTAWGTIFVVLATIAGIYGMNFKYMPELDWRYGYPMALGLMAAITAALYVYFKRKDFL